MRNVIVIRVENNSFFISRHVTMKDITISVMIWCRSWSYWLSLSNCNKTSQIYQIEIKEPVLCSVVLWILWKSSSSLMIPDYFVFIFLVLNHRKELLICFVQITYSFCCTSLWSLSVYSEHCTHWTVEQWTPGSQATEDFKAESESLDNDITISDMLTVTNK